VVLESGGWIEVLVIVVRGGGLGLVVLLVGEVMVLWELKPGMWLGEGREC
jgi:hypothetical protein